MIAPPSGTGAKASPAEESVTESAGEGPAGERGTSGGTIFAADFGGTGGCFRTGVFAFDGLGSGGRAVANSTGIPAGGGAGGFPEAPLRRAADRLPEPPFLTDDDGATRN
jgi:hypothetical protein